MNKILMRIDPKDNTHNASMLLLNELVRKILNSNADFSQIDIEVNFTDGKKDEV